ncbi:hypothetical protein [Amycolatopsis keratiniphila]|uniref:hypothetical protein n=1 Tax=Amycolatopsis keratiniphila TaxID=129921 RepID=UPI001177ED15|nr:hypothetical protein [Amycolatopsis keratiniphila]
MLLDLLPARLTRRSPAWRDLGGWTLDPAHADDPRTPDLCEPDTWRTRLNPWWTNSGPWRPAGVPAHGIYHRSGPDGLTDWAAAVDGWMIWRWRGPRMTWRSELVSPWNPIRAQRGVILDELVNLAPEFEDAEEWIGEAIHTGRKPAGYFGIRQHPAMPRSAMRSWAEQATEEGLVVRLQRPGCWAFAAQPGTLADRFDLPGLATEYRRVLPGDLGERAAADLLAWGHLELIDAAEQHGELPKVVRGLVFGYPPEVTAGVLLTEPHWAVHRSEGAEFGAYCPRCDPTRTRRNTRHDQ